MNITIKWFDGKYPSFNLNLASKEGAEDFLSIKGCRIATGKNGEFVAYPSTKKNDGTYWNHAWGSEKFNEVVLAKALESRPAASAPSGRAPAADFEDSIPF